MKLTRKTSGYTDIIFGIVSYAVFLLYYINDFASIPLAKQFPLVFILFYLSVPLPYVILCVVTGFGLLKNKRWSKAVGIILSILSFMISMFFILAQIARGLPRSNTGKTLYVFIMVMSIITNVYFAFHLNFLLKHKIEN